MRDDLTEVEEILLSSLFMVVGTPNSIETVHMGHVFNEAVGSPFFFTPESVLIVRCIIIIIRAPPAVCTLRVTFTKTKQRTSFTK